MSDINKNDVLKQRLKNCQAYLQTNGAIKAGSDIFKDALNAINELEAKKTQSRIKREKKYAQFEQKAKDLVAHNWIGFTESLINQAEEDNLSAEDIIT